MNLKSNQLQKEIPQRSPLRFNHLDFQKWGGRRPNQVETNHFVQHGLQYPC
jgi:hypothetical protein